MTDRETVCFHCGHSVANSLLDNRLANGRACSVCRDRLLDQVPAALPMTREADAPEFDPAADEAFSDGGKTTWGHLAGARALARFEDDDDGPIGA